MVRTTVTHSAAPTVQLFCYCHILTSSEQTHGSKESICWLYNETMSKGDFCLIGQSIP